MNRLIGLTALLLPASALAHHPLAGMEMTTFTHGLLSGIGHPLLGFDHLFFVALVGVAALYTGRARTAPLAYIITMLVGCTLMAFGFTVPGVEFVIALSLQTLGGVVLSGRSLGLVPALTLFGLAGLFHGAAFGESMVAAEASAAGSVLTGYLLGLGVLQYFISLGAGWALRSLWHATEAGAVEARLAGALVGGVGLFLALEQMEGAAFTALGIG